MAEFNIKELAESTERITRFKKYVNHLVNYVNSEHFKKTECNGSFSNIQYRSDNIIEEIKRITKYINSEKKKFNIIFDF